MPATALGLQEAAAALPAGLLGQDHQTEGRSAETRKFPWAEVDGKGGLPGVGEKHQTKKSGVIWIKA